MIARKMKSLRMDEELCAWSEEYARERGVPWAQVVDAALRELQASAMGGVPDLGPDSKPAGVTPLVSSGGGSVHQLASARAWAWEQQKAKS